jgi:hypothetical protein
MDERERLAQVLRQGLHGSGNRMGGMPAPKSRPFLFEAAAGLKKYVQEHPDDEPGLRLLAQAEEALCNYSAARRTLEKCMKLLGRRDKRDLKWLARLREMEDKWLLSPALLKALALDLDRMIGASGCAHTFQRTKDWLRTKGIREVTQSLDSLRRHFSDVCDCSLVERIIVELDLDRRSG